MENTPEKNLEMTQKYDASDIQVLEGLDAVAQASRYVHRFHRTTGSASSGV